MLDTRLSRLQDNIQIFLLSYFSKILYNQGKKITWYNRNLVSRLRSHLIHELCRRGIHQLFGLLSRRRRRLRALVPAETFRGPENRLDGVHERMGALAARVFEVVQV
jgi:hypothetical protein